MIWYNCTECSYGTNVSAWADDHEDDTRHAVIDVTNEEEN